MSMRFLYLLTVAIWGSTWYVIHFQLGVTPVEWSVAIRFALAASLMGLLCLATRRSLRVEGGDHKVLIAIGLCNYSANYILFYIASGYLTTGIVAVSFALITVANTLHGRLFLRVPITVHVIVGGLLGSLGIAFLFWPEIQNFTLADQAVLGLFACLIAVWFASLGNTMAAYIQRRAHINPFKLNFWGMLYGSLVSFSYAAGFGDAFVLDTRWSYVAALFYLAAFGSVLAFNAYFSLIKNIGLAQAGYVGVLAPIVALSISTVFEGYHWTPIAAVGVLCCLAGNVLVLRRRQPVVTRTAPAE